MVNLLVHSIHELTTKLCYKLMMIKRHVVDPLKFFFFFFFFFFFLIITKKKKKKKKKVSCYEDKVFTSNNWMSVLANMGKYHNDKCMHLSKEWKSRNMIIVSIQKKKKKMIMSGCLFSKRFVRLSFQKANLLYLTLSFISRIIAPCVNFNQNRDETTSGYSFFFLIGTSG